MAKKVILKSCDGDAFVVDESVALQSKTIKHMIEDECSDGGIPIPGVTSKILAKVIDYCKKHSSVKFDDEWDAEFVKVDPATLCSLIAAANFLNITSLLDITCQAAATMVTGKTTEEIRKTLSIDNDFTLEEEDKVRWETRWEPKDFQKRYLYSSGARGGESQWPRVQNETRHIGTRKVDEVVPVVAQKMKRISQRGIDNNMKILVNFFRSM